MPATLLALMLLFGVIETKPTAIITEVYLGERGPYRFLVDTGAQTTMIDDKLAGELRLQPKYRVEIIMQHGTTLSPATMVGNLIVGSHRLAEVEMVFFDLKEAQRTNPGIRGVLGMNALQQFDFELTSATRSLGADGVRPEGAVVPFKAVNGRYVVKARMGKETLSLALDSGASHMVLFRTPAAMAKTRPVSADFVTLDGARRSTPTTWTADLFFGAGLRVKTLPAAIVTRPSTEVDGLLPSSAFARVYVDHRRRELILVR